MKTSLSVLALSLSTALLGACAAEPAAPTAADAAAPKGDMICGREYATGSSIAVTNCRTTEQAQAEKAAADRSLGASSGGSNAKPGGG
ncbi:MAG: hypothetical protein JO090_13980 [Rhizobacter sp.]|nr:hypothetical protein [Rhizobacter sp.]